MNYNYGQPIQQNQIQPQTQQQYNSQPRSYQTTSWNSRIRPVSSIEEVRAYPVDFDGSIFYFPDIANKRIYTKWINVDGTAGLNMYELKEVPAVTNNSINYITREEFEEAMNQLKMTLTIQTNQKIEEEQSSNPILQF